MGQLARSLLIFACTFTWHAGKQTTIDMMTACAISCRTSGAFDQFALLDGQNTGLSLPHDVFSPFPADRCAGAIRSWSAYENFRDPSREA